MLMPIPSGVDLRTGEAVSVGSDNKSYPVNGDGAERHNVAKFGQVDFGPSPLQTVGQHVDDLIEFQKAEEKYMNQLGIKIKKPTSC